ncbi:zinc finger protein ZFPM2-like [Limulus polyphemus]|uniref:Zinc finger protein ZFPM2-like n=1 Tax=Limulus polyphemus TaxID=6850 RepID=A0ABM1TFC3_LIMPO|nr:zinc finger protein ZFPM2-like [Limulus polyphemus]
MSRESAHLVNKHGGYRCVPCGIMFSSEKTLHAHQTFYCSHRQETKDDISFPVQNINQEEPVVELSVNNFEPKPKQEEAREENCSKHNIFQVDITSNDLKLDAHGESENKMITSKFEKFRCSYCFYASDKKSGLTRHMRIHETPISYTSETSPPPSRYCSLCHIQFCSMNTFQAHKKHYCNNRKVQVASSTCKSSVEPQLVESQNFNVQDSEESELQRIPTLEAKEPLINSCFHATSTNPLIAMPYLPPVVVKSISSNVLLPSATVKLNGSLLSESEPTCYSSLRNTLPLKVGIPCDNLPCVQSSKILAEDDCPEEKPSTNNCGEVLKKTQKEEILETQSSGVLGLDKCSEQKAPEKKTHEKEILETQSSGVLGLDKCSEQKAPEFPIDLTVGKDINNANVFISLNEHSHSSSDDNMTVLCKSECHKNIEPHQPYTTMKTELSSAISCGLLPSRLQMSCHKPALVNSSNPFSDVPSSSTNSQALVKQGSSQCKECNIVFYKYENYMIHKKNYCSSRQQKTKHNTVTPSKTKHNTITPTATSSTIIDTELQQDGTCDLEIDSSKITAANKTLETLPSQPIERQYFQFFCLACGVKFTSLKNLKAHQTYYCSKPSEMAGLTSEPTPQGLMCNRCRMCYTSEEVFRSHPCFIRIQNFIFSPFDALSMLSPTTADPNMFNETSSSFKCMFCGYIGHTIRGMRTHVRAHLESNASPSENVSTKNRPQNHESQTHLTTTTNVTHSDEKKKRSASESTRLSKNEDKNISRERRQQKDTSPINLAESTPTSSKYNDNNCKHNFCLFESMDARNRCPSEGVHNTSSERECPILEIERRSSENSPVHQIQSETRVSFKMRDDTNENVKTEESSVLAPSLVQDASTTRGVLRLSKDKEMVARSSSDDEPNDVQHQFLNEQVHWCMLCPYYSKYKGNVVRHIQNTHKDLVNPHNTTMFLLSSSTFLQDTNMASSSSSNDNDPSNFLKESNSQIESYINRKEKKRDLDLDEHLVEEVQQNNRCKRKVSNANRLTRKNQGPKFCKSCNISFKYLPSFIAHKKYYCSSHDRESIPHEV